MELTCSFAVTQPLFTLHIVAENDDAASKSEQVFVVVACHQIWCYSELNPGNTL